MSSIRRLKLIAGAGDPDDALPLRTDLVTAAMKVLEAQENGRRENLDDFAAVDLVFEAVDKLLVRCRLYRAACQRRA